MNIALSLLLGFELAYYLLIVQTGIVTHYNSDLVTLFPMFLGGVIGTRLSGAAWFGISNPVHKATIALSTQLALSFLYPDFTPFTLFLLGLCVGAMAPLGIYLFKKKQQRELFIALAFAYVVGTTLFNSSADSRIYLAVIFSAMALFMAWLLRNYQVAQNAKTMSLSWTAYLPLMLWILLDSNLFETLSRHEIINIWTSYTLIIAISHIAGLVVAYFVDLSKKVQHSLIAILFALSYGFSYMEEPFLLALTYPFVISYYNVVIFRILSKESSLAKLSVMMIFVGWLASGAGLAITLSRVLH